MSVTPYALLGVPPIASGAEIRAAFRRLAAVYHPDRCGSGPTAVRRFQLLVDAHDLLSDPVSRAAYDRAHRQHPRRGLTVRMEALVESLLDRVLERASRGAAPARGPDLRCNLVLTLEQAAAGGVFRMQVDIPRPCEPCAGSGSAPGQMPMACHVCVARPGVPTSPAGRSGECPFCLGRGVVHPQLCPACAGAGRVAVPESVDVRVPPNCPPGKRLRLRGHGAGAERAVGRGDLLVDVQVLEHPLLKRTGRQLEVTVPVSLADALRGGTVEIPTLQGVQSLAFAALRAPQTTLRLAGLGLRDARGQAGDLLVHVTLELPAPGNEPDLARLAELEQTLSTAAYPRRLAYIEALRRLRASQEPPRS